MFLKVLLLIQSKNLLIYGIIGNALTFGPNEIRTFDSCGIGDTGLMARDFSGVVRFLNSKISES